MSYAGIILTTGFPSRKLTSIGARQNSSPKNFPLWLKHSTPLAPGSPAKNGRSVGATGTPAFKGFKPKSEALPNGPPVHAIVDHSKVPRHSRSHPVVWHGLKRRILHVNRQIHGH